MTLTLDQRLAELARRFAEDQAAYARACLRIRRKDGSTGPLVYNRSQLYVHQALERQREELGYVRAAILKARQVGISTYIGSRHFRRLNFSRGRRLFVVAHLRDASRNLFAMHQSFHKTSPDEFRAQIGASNASSMSFPGLDASIMVATAGGRDIGRSNTAQLVHGSEFAFWDNAAAHFAGLMQTVPMQPGTEIILESTANGPNNAFHNQYKSAERGQSQFQAIFVPWFWHEEYFKALPPDGWEPDQDWIEYGEAHGLSPEQLYWAALKSDELASVSGLTETGPCWLFKQEYPATAAEAFQTSGNSFLSPLRILAARRRADIEPTGPIVLGIDPNRGGDDSTAIIDRQGRTMGRHVCELHATDDLMELAGLVSLHIKRLLPLGLRKVVIDITGLGGGLYDRLRELHGDDLIEGVNFGSGAVEPVRYSNRRAEIWDTLREWVEDVAGVSIPDRDDVASDFLAPERGPGATCFNSRGQLVLESKDRIKKRGGSPDYGDAAALTLAVPYGDLVEQRSHSTSQPVADVTYAD